LSELPGNPKFTAKLLRRKLYQKRPVAIEYCSPILYDKSYVGTRVLANDRRETMVRTIIDRKTCRPHASLVVGKKKIGGICHYLLKNYYGDKCDYPWPCRYNEKGEAIGPYVAEVQLLRNVFRLIYLDEQSDLFCELNTGKGQRYFEADYPDREIKFLQHWNLFEGNFKIYAVIYFPKGQTITKIIMEQDNQALVLDEFFFDDKRMENLVIRGKNNKVGDFSLKCIKNLNSSKPKLKDLLKKMPHLEKPIYCNIQSDNYQEKFQLNYPENGLNGTQDRFVFHPNTVVSFELLGRFMEVSISAGGLKAIVDRFSYTKTKLQNYNLEFKNKVMDFTIKCRVNPKF
jgi:hypothetical protein